MSANVVHSLWAVVLAVVAAGCVSAIGKRAARGRSGRRRLAAVLGVPPTGAEKARRGQGLRRAVAAPDGRVVVAIAVVGTGLLGLVAGFTGAGAGLVAAWGLWSRGRRAERAAKEAPGEEAVRQLPLAADLLAACLAAGAGPREAAEAVGSSLGGPVGLGLARAAAEVRLGAEPAVAWGRLGALPGAAPLAGCLERAQATGVPAVEPMARLAARLRAEQARTAGIRARRAGVQATAPLGLCFLPAFLMVGVVPVVIGLAEGLIRAG